MKEIGIEAKGLQLQTDKRTIELNLHSSCDELSDSEEELSGTGAAAYILSKYHISMEAFHELSMIYSVMPRSYKV